MDAAETLGKGDAFVLDKIRDVSWHLDIFIGSHGILLRFPFQRLFPKALTLWGLENKSLW